MARPEKKERPRDAKGTLLRLLRYVADYRVPIAIVVMLSLLSNGLALLGPTLAGKAVGEASAGKGMVNFDKVYYYAGWMLVCYLGSSIVSFVVNITMMRTGRLIARKMRNDVFFKLMELPVSYFDRNQAGDIISRVSYDIDVISTSISADIVQILTSVVTVTGSLVMMVAISPPLAIITLVTVPLSIYYTKKKAQQAPVNNMAGPVRIPMVRSLAPQHNGATFGIGNAPLMVGRDVSGCAIVFREGTAGVSSRHCTIEWKPATGEFYVTDLRSTYGTFLMNGRRLPPNVPCRLMPGDSFYVGESVNVIRVEVNVKR